MISFDIRYLPNQDKEDILAQINDVTDGEISLNLTGSSVKNEISNPYIQKLIQHIKTVGDKNQVELFGQHGFADTRYYSRYDVPAIEFGPSGGEWHGDGEYAIIESLETYKDIIISFSKNFAH